MTFILLWLEPSSKFIIVEQQQQQKKLTKIVRIIVVDRIMNNTFLVYDININNKLCERLDLEKSFHVLLARTINLLYQHCGLIVCFLSNLLYKSNFGSFWWAFNANYYRFIRWKYYRLYYLCSPKILLVKIK